MKKTRYILLLLLAVAALPLCAQNGRNQAYLNYIHRYKDMAIKEMEKYAKVMEKIKLLK